MFNTKGQGKTASKIINSNVPEHFVVVAVFIFRMHNKILKWIRGNFFDEENKQTSNKRQKRINQKNLFKGVLSLSFAFVVLVFATQIQIYHSIQNNNNNNDKNDNCNFFLIHSFIHFIFLFSFFIFIYFEVVIVVSLFINKSLNHFFPQKME